MHSASLQALLKVISLTNSVQCNKMEEIYQALNKWHKGFHQLYGCDESSVIGPANTGDLPCLEKEINALKKNVFFLAPTCSNNLKGYFRLVHYKLKLSSKLEYSSSFGPFSV